jgi:hypothetical protein
MSVETSVQAYLDQVESGEHNRSSVGDKYDSEKDDNLKRAIIGVARDMEIQVYPDDQGSILLDACRYEIVDLVSADPKATVEDVISTITFELQMLVDKDIYHLDWDADHTLNLHEIGENETIVTLTVRKSAGTQQIREKFPFSAEAIQYSWEVQNNKWCSAIDAEMNTNKVYEDDRYLSIFDPVSNELLGVIHWKLIHNNPNGDTTSDDSLELVEL